MSINHGLLTFKKNGVLSSVVISYICKVDYNEEDNNVTLYLLDGSNVVITDISGDFYEKIIKAIIITSTRNNII
jgi:hypothetical protein